MTFLLDQRRAATQSYFILPQQCFSLEGEEKKNKKKKKSLLELDCRSSPTLICATHPISFSPPSFFFHQMSTNCYYPRQISITWNQNLDLESPNLEQSMHHQKHLEASLENTPSHRHYCDEQNHNFEHHGCRNIRSRQSILPVIIALLVLGGLLTWSCVHWHIWSNWGVDHLVRRGDLAAVAENLWQKRQ